MIADTLWESYPNVSSVRLVGESEDEMSMIQKEIVIDRKVEYSKKKGRSGCSLSSNQAQIFRDDNPIAPVWG